MPGTDWWNRYYAGERPWKEPTREEYLDWSADAWLKTPVLHLSTKLNLYIQYRRATMSVDARIKWQQRIFRLQHPNAFNPNTGESGTGGASLSATPSAK